MSWTTGEWDAFVSLLEGWWPGEFSEEAADAWRLALDDVDPEVAITGLKALLYEGRRFRPSASELLAALRRDPATPTFDEAFQLIFGRNGFTAAHVFHRPEPKCHPLVASFVARQGIGRLAELKVDDPAHGELVRKDLKAAWVAHCETLEGRQVAVLASGGRTGLRQLDPLAAIKQIERETT